MTLAEIRARDADLHYCATCGARVFFNPDGTIQGPHGQTVDECEAAIKVNAPDRWKDRVYRGKRDRDTGPLGLCWNARDHHPFVEGDVPDYEQAEADRRWLLIELRALAAIGLYGSTDEAFWNDPDHEAMLDRLRQAAAK